MAYPEDLGDWIHYRCPECGHEWSAKELEEDGEWCPKDECGAKGLDTFLDE